MWVYSISLSHLRIEFLAPVFLSFANKMKAEYSCRVIIILLYYILNKSD